MAEAWLRHLSHGIIPVASAGVKPQGIHPLTLVVMQEAGLDLSHHTAKGMDALEEFSFAIAISVCDYAREECQPFVRARLHLHWSVPQPERLIEAGTPAIEVFRGLRDDLRERVQGLLNILPELAAQHHLLPPPRLMGRCVVPTHRTPRQVSGGGHTTKGHEGGAGRVACAKAEG